VAAKIDGPGGEAAAGGASFLWDIVAGLAMSDATGRWHPVFFRPAPMPGGADGGREFCRYRSVAHHAEGFATEAEAQAYVDGRAALGARDSGGRWAWAGDGAPLITHFFRTASAPPAAPAPGPP
jgi:hypothetical protein